MKKSLRLVILFALGANSLCAQSLFTQITTGPVVTTPSDSRSVNWADVNGDGFEDLFISNGPTGGQNNVLYLNQGNGTFQAVSGDPIVQDGSPSDGATFADTDNDGDLDAFVVTWYGALNYFYRNNGATFTYVAEAVTGNIGTYSETAAWGDYNNDGFVDVYLTNSDGDKRNMLYRNKGDGSFERITAGAWVTEADLSRCVNWVDYDNDGDSDLFVTNESNQANDLFRNDGNGSFTKITTGPLVTSLRGSMSASWGDVDNDGDFDVFVANAGYFQTQNNQLFLNNNGNFTEVTTGQLVTDGGCSYGSAFGDVDNDGDLDLAVANGYCNGTIVNFLYLNDGEGNFTRATTETLTTPCSFGLAFGDYDNDGFLDLAIATCKNANASPQPNNLLYHNNGNGNKWLKIKLEGVVSNRAAIGAKIRIKTIAGWQLRDISAQSGYNGQNSLIAHFGLGTANSVDSVVVEWPSGIRQYLTQVAPNQQLLVVEEDATSVKTPGLFQQFAVNPNPASTTLQLQGNLEQTLPKLQISLMDTTGKVAYQEVLSGVPSGFFSHELDLKKLGIPDGLYHLVLRAGTGIFSTRVVLAD
ncbi:MAG: VCBS repeat-containing protein [Saprospiraceae bacterium]|nr:VCBS repeat-containing protein [Saprospiraceae bacterium]